MPQEEEDDFTPTETPKQTPPPPAKSKFPPSLVRQALAMGLTQEDVDWCESITDLKNLIEVSGVNAARVRDEQDRQARQKAAETPKPSATPEADEEWSFEEDLSWADQSVQKELKRLGKELLRAKKVKDSETVTELKKEMAEIKAELDSERKKNHPLFKRFVKKVAKHTDLFGDGEDEPAGTAERARYETLVRYLSQDGRLTNSPEEDVDKAIAALFPSYQAPAAKKTAKQLEWDNAGQAPATRRNGADRTGIPGGRKAAIKKAAEHMRLNGQDPGPIDDDDDDDI